MTTPSISPAMSFPIESSKKPALSPGRQIPLEFRGTGLFNMKTLGGAEKKKPLKIESSNREVAMSMAQSSRTCSQKADSIGLRATGCIVGAVRAFGLLFYIPITMLKYLLVAALQALRGEGERARMALKLALSAPVWVPLDGAYKTYRRFALYGDDKLANIDSNVYPKIEKTWLEKRKEFAKDGVIDPKTPWLSRSEGIGCACYC